MISQLIANEIAILSRIKQTNSMDTISAELNYPVMFIINALEHGQRQGKFTYDKQKRLITVDPELDVFNLAVTDDTASLSNEIEIYAGVENQREQDTTVEELHYEWLGAPMGNIRVAVAKSPRLEAYDLSDPKDKANVYTFITLKENFDKQWGKKKLVARSDKKQARKG